MKECCNLIGICLCFIIGQLLPWNTIGAPPKSTELLIKMDTVGRNLNIDGMNILALIP
jgi:hypothetical protein